MNPEVTIIIPCYNCEKTLEEAFTSALLQEIDVPFEIIMVDDGSTDGTKALMQKLAEGKENVRVFFHEFNKGGGATRNTAIKNAQAEVIFCLDSDDILPETSLSKMYSFLKEKSADAVGIHRSLKFKGADKTDIFRTDVFGYVGERIPTTALIEKSGESLNPLYSTFMHTKEAFNRVGGYTEFHGFDTQSLAWRFLAHGLRAYTCPDAEYLHRQHFGATYYIREYESGKFNYNWFEIYDEFIFLFQPALQREILSFDFKNPNELITTAVLSSTEPFDHTVLSHLDTWYKEEHIDELTKSDNLLLRYWAGSELLRKGQYERARRVLESIPTSEFPHGALREKIELCTLCLQGKFPRDAHKEIESKRIYIKRGSQAPIASRIFGRLKREIKTRPLISRPIYAGYSFVQNIKSILKRHTERKIYYKQIEEIKQKKEIVFHIHFGGLGDWLVFTSLPRLLSEQCGVSFYISQKSLENIRNKDIYRLCFEINPYCKGIKDTENYFEFKIFPQDKSVFNFITDEHGISLTEEVEKQFGLNGKGVPEIYYTPKDIPEMHNVILVDKNYISGKKLGWIYNDDTFTKAINSAQNVDKLHSTEKDSASADSTVEYVDPTKQDLFAYVDKIHSSKHFITVLSGGAALAACLTKPFTAILPRNIYGGSVDNFVFKKSKGVYYR